LPLGIWGTKMRAISLVAMATAGFAAPVLAADFPAVPYTKAPPMLVAALYDWSGFYVGANGGWGGDRKCWSLNNNGAPVVPAVDVGCNSGNGGVAGGQIGYRWQASNWVFGLEAQGDWTNLKGSNISLNNPSVTNQSRINALGLFTGHIGYAWSNALFYLKGGAAVAADKYNGLGTASGIAFDQAKETRWGGTVGAGVEYAFAPNWSVGVEYDHLFMGRANDIFVSTGMGPNNLLAAGLLDRGVNIRQDVDMVTARINYRWGNPAGPRY
jgi:outer membrane immunogenic protein